MSDIKTKALELHEKAQGKFEIVSRVPVTNAQELSLAYTPGVAEPCLAIRDCKEDVYRYTRKGNLVAIVTDGTAILGLGDIGPEAGLPVMEGKAVLFKNFAGVDAIPLCLATKDVEEIISAVKAVAPTFGGINLEDISAPRCFEVEKRLVEELDIPVFHDDQHGTAIVVLSAMMNALQVTGRSKEDVSIVINGIGAAGSAIANLLLNYGIKNLRLCDKTGRLRADDESLDPVRRALAMKTNPENKNQTLAEALEGADAFIGVSAPGLVTREMVSAMAKDAIIFAMANPTPEIFPEEAKAGGAAVIGTGRSDYPNQINNVLAFPGIFRGSLDVRARVINEDMKLAAAHAIAQIVVEDGLTYDHIIPHPFDKRVAQRIADAVKQAARASGVARI